MEQLLLVTSCDSPAGIGASLRGQTDNGRTTHGWTHRRDVGKSILYLPLAYFALDLVFFVLVQPETHNWYNHNFTLFRQKNVVSLEGKRH